MLLDLERMSTSEIYHLMTQVVIPRPIAWVVSDNGPDAEARWNLAPFSYFNAVASDPPTVMFSVGRSNRDGVPPPGLKDTLANVSVRSEHTIALPTGPQLEAVEVTAIESDPGASEFEPAGLRPTSWDWPVPMPSGVRAALGCTVDRIVPIGEGPQRVVLARVHRVWVDDQVLGVDGKGRFSVDPVMLDPLLRLGAGTYATLGPVAPRTTRP